MGNIPPARVVDHDQRGRYVRISLRDPPFDARDARGAAGWGYADGDDASVDRNHVPTATRTVPSSTQSSPTVAVGPPATGTGDAGGGSNAWLVVLGFALATVAARPEPGSP